eukprot:gnl/Dysnectes_brevis/1905_a2187_1663.p1 GENE.gnl/Dysnectes_brevis/1905_a2187_1663~~gnl/Dysnectes_brevis/1905_a2187_1663.p1  ORF type:complete len:379 (+),score=74.38 gnl/Dysnectes_brevis/1905_a2187_1663:70-1206(+)
MVPEQNQESIFSLEFFIQSNSGYNSIMIQSKFPTAIMARSKVLCTRTFGDVTYTGTSGGTVRVYNWKTGNLVKKFCGHEGPVTSMAFDLPKREMYTGSWDNHIFKWNMDTTEKIADLYDHLDFIKYITLTRDARYLYSSCAAGFIKRWDTATGEVIASIEAHKRSADHLSLSPDEELLASVSSDCATIIWDAATLKQVYRLEDQVTSVWRVYFHEGYLWTTCADNTVRVWELPSHTTPDPKTGVVSPARLVHELVVGDWIWDICFSKDHTVFLACRNKCVEQWTIHPAPECLRKFRGHRDGVTCVEMRRMKDHSKEGSPLVEVLVSGSWDWSIRRWRLEEEAAPEEESGSIEDTDDLLDDPEVIELQQRRMRIMLGME